MEEILALIQETEKVMVDLLFSGFNSVHSFTIEELKRLKEMGERYGMKSLANMIEELKNILESKRHSFHFQYEKLTEIYFNINRYLDICKRKLEFEKALEKVKKPS